MSIFGALIGGLSSIMAAQSQGKAAEAQAAAQIQSQKLASSTNRLGQATQAKSQSDIAALNASRSSKDQQLASIDQMVNILRSSFLGNFNLPG